MTNPNIHNRSNILKIETTILNLDKLDGAGSTDEGAGSTDEGAGSTDDGAGSTDDGAGSTKSIIKFVR